MITNSLIKGSVFIDLSPSPSPSPSPRSLKVCSYLSQQAFNYRLIVLFVVCFFFVWRLMVGVGECHGKAWTCIVLLKKKKKKFLTIYIGSAIRLVIFCLKVCLTDFYFENTINYIADEFTFNR